MTARSYSVGAQKLSRSLNAILDPSTLIRCRDWYFGSYVLPLEGTRRKDRGKFHRRPLLVGILVPLRGLLGVGRKLTSNERGTEIRQLTQKIINNYLSEELQ